ncbi:hypothetical protein HRG_002338 [Hirsutella rhossiliensis]|uniref:Uncharacterized protein n=1 Tax=Hirsutella rhossiliensis TaxID=111463 RepID=A0A9P8N6Z8_9HYPO|nr:uncharacterized protein HRG_02338 [Hirsutella rhossiliensis]KAH0966929.1 hypothetical protein HRG_02338 [Hirsutella rhossiliensis]
MALRLQSLTSPCARLLLLLAALAAPGVVANVEKVIFTGPAPANIPLVKPSLSDLNLDSLTPESSVIRTNLSRAFPSGPDPRGTSAWLLLDHLAEGQRYEVRVCWAAIEPTSFSLHVHELETVWGSPELIQSLAGYASNRQTDSIVVDKQESEARRSAAQERKASVLFLHVQAAADYFTDDVSLMAHPPPVLVDLILDPFIYNVIPHSLIPTAGYLVLVGVVTWFLARWISSSLQSVAGPPRRHAKKRD